MSHLLCCTIDSSQCSMALLGTVPDEMKAFSDFKAMVNCYLTTEGFRFCKHFLGIIYDFCLLLLDISCIHDSNASRRRAILLHSGLTMKPASLYVQKETHPRTIMQQVFPSSHIFIFTQSRNKKRTAWLLLFFCVPAEFPLV